MKIVVISDIHDNLENLQKCLGWCEEQGIDSLFCCGDITNSETLEFISKNFLSDIYLVRGNMDIYDESEVEKYKNIKYFGRVGRFDLDGKNIGLCHEPFLIEKVLEKGDCDIVFYGHTHKPWIEKQKGVDTINPGTLGGVFQSASFSFWDTRKNILELKVLDQL